MLKYWKKVIEFIYSHQSIIEIRRRDTLLDTKSPKKILTIEGGDNEINQNNLLEVNSSHKTQI